MYRDVENYEKSLEMYELAYVKQCKAMGKEQLASLTSKIYLAKEYFWNGDIGKALAFCEEIMNCGGEMPPQISEEIEEIYTQAKKKEKIEMGKEALKKKIEKLFPDLREKKND